MSDGLEGRRDGLSRGPRPRPAATRMGLGDDMNDKEGSSSDGGRRPPGCCAARRGAPRLAGTPYQAVAVVASLIPWASSQRSASIAALQPSPAAVTAWR